MVDINAHSVITLIQALQLVGLIPSLFILFLLAILLGRSSQAVVPVLYFLSLSCTFAIPLLGLYVPLGNKPWLEGALLLGESLLVAFSFLLVLQFITGQIPALRYWLVLAVPLVGGSSLVYAIILQSAAGCAADHSCGDAAIYKTLYNIFASSLVFLLLVYYSSRFSALLKEDANRRHKYWLIISLILLNVCVLAIDLAQLAGRMQPAQADFIVTLFRLTFIYLVITSLFRVFYPSMAGEMVHIARARPLHNPAQDLAHVTRVRELLEAHCVYREMRLNRAALAYKVGISEYTLSRIINHYMGKSFNELVNGYRIEEAKRRLRAEPGKAVTVIAFETGFNSIASFNRVFRELAGMSPTEWRNQA